MVLPQKNKQARLDKNESYQSLLYSLQLGPQLDELFVILKGQDYTKFDKDIDWYEQFDGSGIKGWWD